METSIVDAQIIDVGHSDNSNLNENNDAEVVSIEEGQTSEIPAGESEPVITAKEKGNDDKQREDDQESVIIEEVENKTIELNEDSDQDISANVEQKVEESTNVNKNKAHEFVIVNAANMVEVPDDPEKISRYAMEDLQIKDELEESVAADLHGNDVLENDPMDLLELNNRSDSANSTGSQEDTDDYGDDISSIGSSSVQTGTSVSTSILDKIKNYPWLLYEEGDEPFGYCLYCDTKLNTKSQRSVKQHGMSLYHKERCENYLAFREEEEKNGLSMQLVDIKEEFGTDSRVEALKLKRKSQSGALNNFNWRRWLQSYPWLVRDSAEGTVGYCKYCLMHVNVEFSYLRDRHQEGVKHKEAERQHEEANDPKEPSNPSDSNDDQDTAVDKNHPKSQRWLGFVDKEPSMVRCKLCGSKMFKNNFLRHLRTNLHVQNEVMFLKNQKGDNQKKIEEISSNNQQSWKLYTKYHQWLVSDPTDPYFAYCKYCEKRIIYGSSAAKRATHENSSQHKSNAQKFKNISGKISSDKKQGGKDKGNNGNNKDRTSKDGEVDENNQDQNEENEEDNGDDVDDDGKEAQNNNKNGEDNDGEEEEDEEEEDEDNQDDQQGKEIRDETKKRVPKLSDDWISQYPWCIRSKKDPKNFIFCIYCKIPLKVTYSRSKHQNTSFHISAEKQFLDGQPKKQKLQDKKQANATLPVFEWAMPLKNNPSSYSCRYCRVRISKNYSKKQHESSKIHQINESIYKSNRRKSVKKDENSNDDISNESPKSAVQVENAQKMHTYSKVVVKAPSTVTLIKQLQKKFPWLSHKRSELRSHYGYCKICDCSLYVRSLKHVSRHLRSTRHLSIIRSKKKQEVPKQEEEDEVEEEDVKTLPEKMIKKASKEELQTTPPANNNTSQNSAKLLTTEETYSPSLDFQRAHNYKSTIAEMKKRYSWIEKSETPNYALCRFCNCNIPLKILFLRNHSNSRKHRHCVINYYTSDGKKSAREPNSTNFDTESKFGDGDDVMLVEDNNEEVLISEQDENWTVKSETMDEHEELDYLLQRSFNNTTNTPNVQRHIRKNVNIEEAPPPKRIKRSQSFKRLNDSNTSLVASLLTTPLTLASCLGPLIQQQIQQQSNISQTNTNESTSALQREPSAHKATGTDCENTYDLFFKSVSETMKKLPVDLAAEGKLKVMQIICDLELQALKRQQISRSESASGNNSDGLSYQATSTSTGMNSLINDVNIEQNGNINETLINQLNNNNAVSPPSKTHLGPSKVTNSKSVEMPAGSSANSPLIGVMDKNGLQTLQLKNSGSKQISRNTAAHSGTTIANSGIRCIPFKNLSQSATPDGANSKITRIQVPMNVQKQSSTPNTNSASSSKNLISLRNFQIAKRIHTTATSATSSGSTPHSSQHTPTMNNNNSQRSYMANIKPHLQRWGCSVNGSTSRHNPSSPTVNHLKQLSSQQTSTPISK